MPPKAENKKANSANATTTSSSSSSPSSPPPSSSFPLFKIDNFISPFDSLYPSSVSHNDWIIIKANPLILKHTLKKGDESHKWFNKERDWRVCVNILGRYSNGDSFIDWPLEEYETVIKAEEEEYEEQKKETDKDKEGKDGKDTASPAPKKPKVLNLLDLIISDMRVGEESLFGCHEAYASDKYTIPDYPIVNGRPLFFFIRLIRAEREFDMIELNEEDKFIYAENRRQLGKELIDNKKPRSALSQYEKGSRALAHIEKLALPQAAESKIRSAQAVLKANSSACRVILKDYGAAVSDCTESLEFDKNQAKIIFRRAEANRMQGEYFNARRDFQRLVDGEAGLTVEEKFKTMAEAGLKACDREEAAVERQQARQFKGAFSGAARGEGETKPLNGVYAFFHGLNFDWIRRCCGKREKQQKKVGSSDEEGKDKKETKKTK